MQAAADIEACWQDLNLIWQQLATVRQLQQAWADFVTGYIDQVSLRLRGGATLPLAAGVLLPRPICSPVWLRQLHKGRDVTMLMGIDLPAIGLLQIDEHTLLMSMHTATGPSPSGTSHDCTGPPSTLAERPQHPSAKLCRLMCIAAMQVAMLESKITCASSQADMQKLSAELSVLHRTWASREETLQGLRARWRELHVAASGLCQQGLTMFGVPEPGTGHDSHSSGGTGSSGHSPLPLSPAAAVQQALHRAAMGLQGLSLWSLAESAAEDGASAASTESWQADAALLGCLHTVLQAVCSGPEELPGGSVDSVGSGSSSPAVARQGPLLHPAAAAAAAAEAAELELAGLVQRYLLPRLQSALHAFQSHGARTCASKAGGAADELQDLSLSEVDDVMPDYSSHPPGAWRPVPDMEPLTGTEACQGAADEEQPLELEPGLSSSSALEDELLASSGTHRQQQKLDSEDNAAGGVCEVLDRKSVV